jgi:putative oxidoreductase
MKEYLPLTGRILFSLIFLMTVLSHFKKTTIAYAESQGVPFSDLLVPLSAIIAFLGGLSITLGYKARIGAWLIVVFLVPVSFYMHAFWSESDPMKMQMQAANFMKNMGLLGGALLICYFGSGPLSLDNKPELSGRVS